MEALPPLDTMSLIQRIEALEQELRRYKHAEEKQKDRSESTFAVLSAVMKLLEEGLTIDGAHHKQWYLWRIADALGLSQLMEIDVDKGIAP